MPPMASTWRVRSLSSRTMCASSLSIALRCSGMFTRRKNAESGRKNQICFAREKSRLEEQIKSFCVQPFFQFIIFRPQTRVQMNCQRDEWRVFFINAGTQPPRFNPMTKWNRGFIHKLNVREQRIKRIEQFIFGQICRGKNAFLVLEQFAENETRAAETQTGFHQKNFADARTAADQCREKNVRVNDDGRIHFRSWLK